MTLGLGLHRLGFRIQGLGFRVYGLGFRLVLEMIRIPFPWRASLVRSESYKGKRS